LSREIGGLRWRSFPVAVIGLERSEHAAGDVDSISTSRQLLVYDAAVSRAFHGGTPFMELALDVRQAGSYSVVDVRGEIDVYTAPKLREKLIELVSQGSYDVVVNLEGVDFLDSTGLGVLVGALKRVKAHDGTLSLVCTQEKILKIFKITGLTKVFPIHDSVEAAAAEEDDA
jgi:anti-sigma B factor antagonist